MEQPTHALTTRSLLCNGARINVSSGGSGDPLLLLHGWPQTSRAWQPIIGPLLELGWHVIAPDLRGTGESERTEGGYGKDDQAEDMRQLLDQLDVTGPVRVVAHDIGGMVAFAMARLHPALVSHLALVDLAVPGLGLEEAMDVARGGRWHFGLFMQPDVPAMLISGHEEEFFRWWFTAFAAGPGALPPGSVETYTRSYTGHRALDSSFGHYRTLLADGQVNDDWASRGGTLAMPVLAVGGELSAGARLAWSLRGVCPRVEPVVVSGSGHFVAEEKPADLLRALRRFLAPDADATTPTTPDPAAAPHAGDA